MGLAQGWLGHWSPGIGDPTPAGWLTVVVYAVATGMVYRVIAREVILEPWLGATESACGGVCCWGWWCWG